MTKSSSLMNLYGYGADFSRGLVVGLSFWLYGYNQAVAGGFLSLRSWGRQFPALDTSNTSGRVKAKHLTVSGVVLSSFTMGAIISSLTCSLYGEKLGKIKTMQIAAFMTLVGEIMQDTSFHLPQFVVGRVIIGAGVGILSVEVPNWQAECSDPKNRGRHVVISGLAIAAGFMCAAWFNFFCYLITIESLNWRLPAALPILVSLILIILLQFQSESPLSLVRNGQIEAAKAALAALKGVPLDSEDVATEIQALDKSSKAGKDATKLKDVISNRRGMLRSRFLLCFFLQFCQQMCGSNLISVYATHIFQENLGLSPELAHALSGGALTWKFISSFVALFTIDRFGRRALFMFSGAGMAACMTGLCIAASFGKENSGANAAAVCCIFMFNFFLPIGFLGANFLYCSEVAPSSLRLAITSISTANHWLWNLVIVLATPVAIENVGFRYYILFIIITSCIPIAVFFFYPETNKRSLEQLETIFESSSSIFEAVKASKKPPILEDIELDAKTRERKP